MLVLTPTFLAIRGILVDSFDLSIDFRVIHSNLEIRSFCSDVETDSKVVVDEDHISHYDLVRTIESRQRSIHAFICSKVAALKASL